MKINYFDLFGIDVGYHIDDSELEDKYKELQQKYHPDLFMNKSQSERVAAVHMSSIINDGYYTLKEPVLRGFYILQSKGIDIKNVKADSSWLAEMMELSEQVENVSAEAKGKAESRFKETQKQFIEFLESGALEAASQLALKMQFLSKIVVK